MGAAGARTVATLRRPRPGGDDRLSAGAGGSGVTVFGEQGSWQRVSRIRELAGLPETTGIVSDFDQPILALDLHRVHRNFRSRRLRLARFWIPCPAVPG